MPIIDLSHFLEPGMPVYPGTDPCEMEPVAHIQRDRFREMRIRMCSHTGTHMDAPAHVLQRARTLDRMPLDTFYGDASILHADRVDRKIIELNDLVVHEKSIRNHPFLLLHTGWSRYWGKERYFRDYPVLSEEAARWLAASGVKGVGMDTISADPEGDADLTVHHILLGAGMIIVENLTNLAALPNSSFLFSCFPLKIRDADGSPVRAVAVVP